MRVFRLFLLFLLAVVLVLLSVANRELITVNLVPEALTRFTQGQWSLTMPAFLALFAAMVFGLIVGLVWEWLREAGLRSQAKARSREVARLEREIGKLGGSSARTKDDVLAILDAPSGKPAASAGGLPATR